MLDPVELLCDAVSGRLLEAFAEEFEGREPAYPEILDGECRWALSEISRSDALYHDAYHTAMVTLVGQVILQGRRRNGGQVTPSDWLHVVLSLLFHDIGHVGGLCPGDEAGRWATGLDGKTIAKPRGATDASLAPFHVDRGRLVVRERFADHPFVDAEILAASIERTRIPVPSAPDYQRTTDLAGLVRAADLIGQLAEPGRDRKLPALFYEFEETGVNAKLGFSTPGDLAADYPRFFWTSVAPYVGGALTDLQATVEGRDWIASLLRTLPETTSVEQILAAEPAEKADEAG